MCVLVEEMIHERGMWRRGRKRCKGGVCGV